MSPHEQHHKLLMNLSMVSINESRVDLDRSMRARFGDDRVKAAREYLLVERLLLLAGRLA